MHNLIVAAIDNRATDEAAFSQQIADMKNALSMASTSSKSSV